MNEVITLLQRLALNLFLRQPRQYDRNFGDIDLFEYITPIVTQAMALWILRWTYSEKFSSPQTLHAHFVKMYQNNPSAKDTYESCYKNFQRTSKMLHGYNNQFRINQRAQGIPAPEPVVLQSKHQGILIPAPNWQVIQTWAPDSPISTFLKKICGGQMENPDSVSNAQFAKLFGDYEAWCNALTEYTSEDEYLINSLNFFLLQTKLKVDLIAEVAAYMEQHGYKEYPLDRAVWFWHALIYGPCVLAANQVLTDSRAIPIVFSYAQEDFEVEAQLCFQKREIQAILLNFLLNDIGYDALTIEKAAAFFKEHYDLLSHRTATDFGTEKVPYARRIRAARTIMKSLHNRANIQTQEFTT